MPKPRRRALRRKTGPGRSAAAEQAWRTHKQLCHRCTNAHGHPAYYCDEGWKLALEVTRVRQLAAESNITRTVRGDTLW